MRYAKLYLHLTFIGGCYFSTNAQDLSKSFRKQVIDSNIQIGYGIAIGDVDGDKKPDVILADKKQIVWYRNPDWRKTVIAENLTESDHVCVAAADLDGDSKVEIAVGAQWNPGETSDDTKSGAVFFLQRPADENGKWQPMALHHEPTVHRMKWVRLANNKFYLVVAPLHGRGNKQGEGAGAKILAYEFKKNSANWPVIVLDSALHLTHNFAPEMDAKGSLRGINIASKEGIIYVQRGVERTAVTNSKARSIRSTAPAGEISLSHLSRSNFQMATIEPMHGNSVVIYNGTSGNMIRTVLDSTLKEGHGLAVADLFNSGTEQVIAGWRQPDVDGKTGIKIYHRTGPNSTWQTSWLDQNGVAVEDLQVIDLNEDGRPEIIASGRATHNVVIYWNEK
jgi:VCBS repeat protein/aldos-2-ulose dehydratase/isomerase family protein